MAASDWSERTRMLVTIGVSVAINAGLGYWLYTAYGNYRILETQLKNKNKQIVELKDIVNNEGPKLQAKLKTTKIDLAAKESKLPEQEEVNKLIDDMAAIGATTGCLRKSFVMLKTDDAALGASYVRSTWKTQWEADFMGWCRLLNAMEEKFPRFISFENLTITPKNQGMVPTGARHTINVDVVTYRYLRK